MDISESAMIGEGLPPQAMDQTFTELLVPLFREPQATSELKPAAAVSEDVLQVVKLDPAVLEAQVTLDNSTRSASAMSGDGLSKDYAKAPPPPVASSGSKSQFKHMMDMQRAALLSLSPQQFDLLMKFADTLRRQRLSNQIKLECAFCKNNGESVAWYSSHGLRSWRGWVQCPVLRAYHCPRCGATGDRAHTIKYCPENYHRGEGMTRVYYRSTN